MMPFRYPKLPGSSVIAKWRLFRMPSSGGPEKCPERCVPVRMSHWIQAQLEVITRALAPAGSRFITSALSLVKTTGTAASSSGCTGLFGSLPFSRMSADSHFIERVVHAMHFPAQRTHAHGKLKSCKTNFWRRKMAKGCTQGGRTRQAVLIQCWKPWQRSTGPRTSEGKARVVQNAYKGGTRSMLRALSRLLKDQEKRRKNFV